MRYCQDAALCVDQLRFGNAARVDSDDVAEVAIAGAFVFASD